MSHVGEQCDTPRPVTVAGSERWSDSSQLPHPSSLMFGPKPPSRLHAVQSSMMAILPVALLLHRRIKRKRLMREAILAAARFGAAPIEYPTMRLNVHTWHPRACYLTTRFYPHELVEMYESGAFPATIRLENRAKEDGLTGLAMFCARMATPSRRVFPL